MGQGAGPGAGADEQGSHLEFDQSGDPSDERAKDVMGSRDTRQKSLRANRAVVGDPSLDGVLTRMIEAACELVDASYGAIGVNGPDGSRFEQFVYVGMDSEEARLIGHLPEGKGVLGALIDDPRPLRLRDIRDDPRSVGFPTSHPPMRAFLGVPISVRGEVFGSLYLASLTEGDFDAEDEQLVLGLAATAGVAIENARIYEEARHRQKWLEASTDMTRRVLADPSQDALQTVGQRVAELADADLVTVALPSLDAAELQVVVAVGAAGDELKDFRYPLPGTISERVLTTGESEVFEDVGALRPPSPPLRVLEVVSLGPVMVLPLAGAEGVRGVLVVGRTPGRRAFGSAEVDMATNFAHHASVALELADARHEAQRIALLEDRARIARDLHDHVIQQLFAAGMTLQASLPTVGEGPAGESIDRVVDIIDDAIRKIRASIFQLRPRTVLGGGLRSAVLAVVSEATPALGWDPPVHFVGAVDAVSDEWLVDDVEAVVREALSNVARHARAQHAEVSVTVRGAEVEVVVEDDGVGLGGSGRNSGLTNLRQRAQGHSGTFEVGPGQGGRGTRLVWTVRVDRST